MEIKENINISIHPKYSILFLEVGNNDELHYSYKTICNFYDALPIISENIIKEGIKYVVLKSPNQKVWNMGGDLDFFLNCINDKDKAMLRDYAHKCVNIVYTMRKKFNSDAVVVSLIQGNAYGGGFECALAGDYIIAEEQVKFSFPETLFGTFPGMGAYSFLTRHLGFEKAHEMIHSSKKWSSLEMKDVNIVNFIASKGYGLETLYNLISNNELPNPDQFSIICKSPTLTELIDVVEIWLDKVMSLDLKKINIMNRITIAQKKKSINF
jgi:DSF synthase